MRNDKPTRRQVLKRSSLLTLAGMPTTSRAARADSAARVESITTISHQPHLYHGWPTLTRRSNGQLLLVYSGGREGHVCPFGRVELMRSNDDGQTWTWPQVVLDGAIDDRDAGVLETKRGTLLVTTFTSLAFEERMPSDDAKRIARWRAVQDRLGANARRKALGCWVIRSTDRGMTWSGPLPCPVNSPHGPIQLADDRVLYTGKSMYHEPERIGVCESTDEGRTWRWLAEIPTRDGDDPNDYHELHAVEAADRRIIAQIRNHNRTNSEETLQTESVDGGQTWTAPRSIGVWGYPSHMLRLKDDRLVMTYGHRRTPFGNQARISNDHGRSWSPPLVVSGDGTSRDLGYPSSVELDNGHLLTAWYEQRPGGPTSRDQTLGSAVLRLARWQLPD